MTQPPPLVNPAAALERDHSGVDVEPLLPAQDEPEASGMTLEPPHLPTPEDLAAQEGVGFALDLEDVLPGPAVGSEVVLLDCDPEAARRLGLRVPQSPSGDTFQPPPEPAPLVANAGEEDVREGEAPAELPLVFKGGATTGSAGASPSQRPSAFPSWGNHPPRSLGDSAILRCYPLAFAWAGLGASPRFGGTGHSQTPGRKSPLPASPGAAMEDLLDLAAVGHAQDGVPEMLLIFKDEVLRGLRCTLRVEPQGMVAQFVAPDDTVRRLVEGTANDLLVRMRRRGLKVGGWTVKVDP